MGNKVKTIANFPGSLLFKCPGCGFDHQVFVDGVRSVPGYENSPVWGWNKSMDKPTFTPSVSVKWPEGIYKIEKVCHSFIKEGKIEFLSDCTHSLAGQTIELPIYDETV